VFGAGYVLIPMAGSTRLLFTMASVTLLVSIIVSWKDLWIVKLAVLMFALLLAFSSFWKFNPGTVVADIETEYSRYLVTKMDVKGKQATVLQTDLGTGQSAIYPDSPDTMVFDYTKGFDVYKTFFPNGSKALLVGGGANVYARHFAKDNPQSQIDVVEIDPALNKISADHFAFTPNERIRLVSEDGRTFLNKTRDAYDIVFLDAFNNASVPFQLTTRETVQKLSDKTSEKGLIVANIIAPLEPGNLEFLESMYSTYQSVFPHVRVYQIPENTVPRKKANLLLVASKQPIEGIVADNEVLARIMRQEIAVQNKQELVLTDEFAPVEQYLNL
jgi:hypothetical protein